jgi:hypothetical protein
MVPHSLAAFMGKNLWYRRNYLLRRVLLTSLVNWMSANAIWLILAVTIERYLVVRTPLYSRIYWNNTKKFTVLFAIFLFTFVITAYHNFEWTCKLVNYCNFTQVQIFCYSVTTHQNQRLLNAGLKTPSTLRIYYIRISTVGNVIFVVFLPIIAVACLTLLLIRQLHGNDLIVLRQHGNVADRRTFNSQKLNQRKKVTFIVVLISICFAITQGPSAVICLWEFLAKDSNNLNTIYKAMGIANSLVIFGKTINFLLFCTVSSHFRKMCLAICFRKFPKVSNIYRMVQKISI